DGRRPFERVRGPGGALLGLPWPPAGAGRVFRPRRVAPALARERFAIPARPAPDRIPTCGRAVEDDPRPARARAVRLGRRGPRLASRREGVDPRAVVRGGPAARRPPGGAGADAVAQAHLGRVDRDEGARARAAPRVAHADRAGLAVPA